MSTESAVARTPEILNAARGILQRQHDWIEIAGFNIGTMGPLVGAEEREAAKNGHFEDIVGVACFIGGARLSAGIHPQWNEITDEGDGPELTVALELMDEAVLRMVGQEAYDSLRDRTGREIEEGPGKLAERYGFEQEEHWTRDLAGADSTAFNRAQGEGAIPVLRTALRIAAETLGEV